MKHSTRALPAALLLSAALTVFALPRSAQAQTTVTVSNAPDTVSISLVPVAQGLKAPVFVTSAGDGSGRLFVLEKDGLIRIIENGQVRAAPFLNVQSIVNSKDAEQGLLGLAFHPNYAQNGLFYIDYTAQDGSDTVAQYSVSADAQAADPASGTVLISVPDRLSNHNGGMLAFGPDGYLYIGMGDGGGAGDPDRNAQNLGSLLGKILRIDVDHQGPGLPYAIPSTNPFTGRDDARGEVWAYGMRNPWRFSFDRDTGDLIIGDVGQETWEEVDFQPATSAGGENYGWNLVEGAHCFPADAGCSLSESVSPVIEYEHVAGNCSITGGYLYRGAASPALQGTYVFGDFCSGLLWSARRGPDGRWSTALLSATKRPISSFGQDEAGEIYLVDISGTVLRIEGPHQ